MKVRSGLTSGSRLSTTVPMFEVSCAVAFFALMAIAIFELAIRGFDLAWLIVVILSSIMLGNSIAAAAKK